LTHKNLTFQNYLNKFAVENILNMIQELFLAFIQAATEFLPISSSGHLALIFNIISEPDLFFITMLHLASLFAVLIFTRREI